MPTDYLLPSATIASSSGNEQFTLSGSVVSSSIHQTLQTYGTNDDASNPTSWIQTPSGSGYFKVRLQSNGDASSTWSANTPTGTSMDSITSVGFTIGSAAMPRRDLFQMKCVLTNSNGDYITNTRSFNVFGLHLWDWAEASYAANWTTYAPGGSGSATSWTEAAIQDLGIHCYVYGMDLQEGTSDNEILRITGIKSDVNYSIKPDTYDNSGDTSIQLQDGIINIEDGKVGVE